MPLIFLIPGILSIISSVFGAITGSQKSSIIMNLLGLGSASSGGIVGAIEQVLGTIEDTKKAEITVQLETLLAQSQTNQVDAKSEHWFQYAWRPFIAWGMGINVVLHTTIMTLIDILHVFGFNITQIEPIDQWTFYLTTGLLGLYMGARTTEKLLVKQTDDQDSEA